MMFNRYKYLKEHLKPPFSFSKKLNQFCWVPVDTSYSGDRDQEDYGLKPAWANRSQDLILKKIFHKWLKV
jgi:hypothetical protein